MVSIRRPLFHGSFRPGRHRLPDYLLGADADDLFGGEIRSLDSAGKIDDQNRKIDRVERLPPLHRRLLQRRVQALLLLVEQFSSVTSLTITSLLFFPSKRPGATHLDVDGLFVARLVTPGTGDDESFASERF